MRSRSRKSSSATACSSTGSIAAAAAGAARPPGARRRPAAGFSLLEVIVALAILGIGLGVIFDGLAQGLRARAAAAENVSMALVAERLLGELSWRAAAPDAVEEGEESGCRWRIEAVAPGTVAAAAADRAPQAPVVEVRLTVTGPSGRRWELATLLPEQSE